MTRRLRWLLVLAVLSLWTWLVAAGMTVPIPDAPGLHAPDAPNWIEARR